LSKAPVDVSAMQLAPAECGETKLFTIKDLQDEIKEEQKRSFQQDLG
jgi:hypothetical protein